MSSDKHVSRRDLFSRFLKPMKAAGKAREQALESSFAARVPDDGRPQKAVVQGRFCLAYHSMSCRACHDSCPEEGAIVLEDGIPRVVQELCTGCRVCHDICPAPTNAILMTSPPGAS